MGELTKQMMTDPSVGSFFSRPDVVAATAAVTDEGKALLSQIVRDVVHIPYDEYGGRLHHCIVMTLSAAFSGQVDRFFHDVLIDTRIRDAAITELRGIERRSNPPTCLLDYERLPLVQQLLTLADLERDR